MFTQEILEKLSYKCGCPLDIRETMGVVNGVCPNHANGILLVDGKPVSAYKAFLQAKKKKLGKQPFWKRWLKRK